MMDFRKCVILRNDWVKDTITKTRYKRNEDKKFTLSVEIFSIMSEYMTRLRRADSKALYFTFLKKITLPAFVAEMNVHKNLILLLFSKLCVRVRVLSSR